MWGDPPPPGGPASDERPPDEVVESIYVEVLEQLAMPQAAAQKLIATESLDKKWKMIQMNRSLLSDSNMQAIRTWNESDTEFLKAVDNAEMPKQDLLRQLKCRMSTANKQWLQALVQNNGVPIIMRAMRLRQGHQPRTDVDNAVLLEAVEALQCLMVTAEGMEEVVNTEGAIEALTLCLDFNCPKLVRVILEILAVTCYFSRPELVKMALDTLHRRHLAPPYELLTTALVESDMAVRNSIITFVNTFINSTQSPDDRIQFRHYLLAQDITKTLEKVVNEFNVEEAADAYQSHLDNNNHLLVPGNATSTTLWDRQSVTRSSNAVGGGGERPPAPSLRLTMGPWPLPDNMGPLAEDNRTGICPERGIMAGKGITAKNKKNQAKQLLTSLLKVSPTKTRWYRLDGRFLSSSKMGTDPDDDAEPATSAISMTEVSDIRPQSSDQDLIKLYAYTFDVVVQSRTYSIAVETEDLHHKWVMALNFAHERVSTDLGRLRNIELLDKKDADGKPVPLSVALQQSLDMFKKQVTIFHAVMATDLEALVKDSLALGEVNPTDAKAMFTFVQKELDQAGFGEQLLRVLHQLVLLPTDYALGRDTWDVLQRVLFDLRNYDRSRKRSFDAWYPSIEEVQTLLLARRELDAKIRRLQSLDGGSKLVGNDQIIQSLQEEIQELRQRLTATSPSQGQQLSPPTIAPPLPPRLPEGAPPRPVHPLAAALTQGIKKVTPSSPSDEDANTQSSSAANRPVHPLAQCLAGIKKPCTDATSGNETTSSSPPRPPHPLASMLQARQQQQKAEGVSEGGDEAKSSSSPPRPPHPLASMLQARQQQQVSEGGDEAGSSPSPPRPSHPLASMLQARTQQQKAQGASDSCGDGSAPLPPRSVHPLAAALKSKGASSVPIAPITIPEGKSDGPKSPENPSLPPKPKVEPPRKMKGLYWSAIPPHKVAFTAWNSLEDFKGIDIGMLLEDFAVSKQETTKASVTVKTDVPKHVSLFDSKRNQNVLIALGRFKMNPEQLRDAVVCLTETFLNSENTQKLMNILPTAEEVNTVHSFEGDVNTLGPVERFFGTISSVPRLEQRLKCWLATLTFDDNLAQLSDKIHLIADGTKAIKASRGFPKVLEVVLAVGNYLNGTSARGGAYGFRIDILSKLNDVKSSSHVRGSLLNYIANQADSKVPQCKDLVQQLAPVHEAAEHSLSQLENDLKAMHLSLTLIKKEMEEMEGLPDEVAKPFKTKMGRFLLRIDKIWQDTNKEMEATRSQLQEVMSSYGEDLNSRASEQDPSQKFFGLLSTFVHGYREALEFNKKLLTAQANNNKGTTTAPGSANGVSEAGPAKKDQNLFKHFTNAQSQKTAAEIVAEFKAKNLKKQVK